MQDYEGEVKFKYLGGGKRYYDREVNHTGTAVPIEVAPIRQTPNSHIVILDH